MAGSLLSDNDRKANLSFVYLSAISTVAGYTCELGPNPDRNSIDASVRSGESMRPQIDIQLKATSTPGLYDDGLHFRLRSKNYNDLCEYPRMCPIILVVLELPEAEDDWLDCDAERLIMRRRAWWLSLSGYDEIEPGSTRTVVLPRSQLLNPDSLMALMSQARTGNLTGG